MRNINANVDANINVDTNIIIDANIIIDVAVNNILLMDGFLTLSAAIITRNK